MSGSNVLSAFETVCAVTVSWVTCDINFDKRAAAVASVER